ncbi:preprotein translocase subunit SecD [Clostridium collagenovorans DSM 3089]|uniref:Protein translocase subunit SecD n=1 Tax=Clostridium collagenovorans DSM 3089 TaxID=1121306 RepID=A0A1M5YD50_9CLOT|nr:protein translocase subunit SecD [Clostridium collagenovorans]SHI09902.1 preprotein translocase subunit SecD [Clostridium collagenovorans DSM 3089]
MKNNKKSKDKAKSVTLLVITILVIATLGFAGLKGFTIAGYKIKPFSQAINRGLDLQGGISVVEEIQAEEVSPEDMSREIEFLSMRVNKLGVSETEVKQEGDKRIRIEIPGIFNSEEVMDVLGKTGELKFVDPNGETILTGKDVKNAVARMNPETQKSEIALEFSDEGKDKFANATKEFVGKQIAIYMDEEKLSEPTVNEPILNGQAVISGSKNLEEAKRDADIIKSGALPLPVKPVSFKTVGSQLGSDAMPNSKKAAILGVGLVFIFMLAVYRLPGLVADLALVLFILLDLYVFVAMEGTLTLAGIAGLLLTIGMAVDANVLIFERIKEEIQSGKSIKASVNAGFDRALTSILDSNITTMIAGIILYNFGTGSVRGFAVTLMIGIVISVFTALIFTKFILRLLLNIGILEKPGYFGVKRG